MPRNIFIGDVHGCLDEFVQLIDVVDPQPEDTLVQMGDLIHKGPDSPGVIDYWEQYSRSHKILVFGNHEEKHLRWLRREKERTETGKTNKMRHVEEYPGTQVTPARAAVLADSYLAYSIGTTLAVHGGIPGNMRHAPPQIKHADWLALPSRQRDSVGQVLRVRYETVEGKMIALGENEPGDPYWAERYDGRYGTVVFGHNPFMIDRPAIFPHAYGIDMGCVHGGYLCALVENNGVFSFKTVRAKRVYKDRPVWTYG